MNRTLCTTSNYGRVVDIDFYSFFFSEVSIFSDFLIPILNQKRKKTDIFRLFILLNGLGIELRDEIGTKILSSSIAACRTRGEGEVIKTDPNPQQSKRLVILTNVSNCRGFHKERRPTESAILGKFSYSMLFDTTDFLRTLKFLCNRRVLEAIHARHFQM